MNQAPGTVNHQPRTTNHEPRTCSKNCNKFTLVRSAECRVMSEGLMIKIEFITIWILKAFLAIAPIGTGVGMGTGLIGDKGRAFPSNFFPNLRNYFFFSSLTTDCRLLTTASSHPLSISGLLLLIPGHLLSILGLLLSIPGPSLSISGLLLPNSRSFALYFRPSALFPGDIALSPKRKAPFALAKDRMKPEVKE